MSPLLKRKTAEQMHSQQLKYSFIAAAFAAGIMLVIYLFHQNTLVFGDLTVLRMDLYHQYGPLYAEVFDRIINGESLIYSWTSGLGASFLGNFFNYCSSPFALVMLICGHKNMPEAIAIMIMLKEMLAAGTFTYYINKSNSCAKKEGILFGLLYAFSAYFVAFSWNIMWFDAFAVFPLVMLGIERIIQFNKPAMYIVTMTYTMITNYYMAYMVCIFSVMYFLYYYFGRYELASKLTRPEPADDIQEPVAEISAEAQITDEETVAAIPEQAAQTEVTTVSGEPSAAPAQAEEAAPVIIADTEASAEAEEYTEILDISENTESEKKNKKKQKKQKTYSRLWTTGWNFALSSILCFLLAAFALIPVYYCLQSSSATAGTFPSDAKQYFDIFRFIANHLTGIEPTIRSSGDNVIPNVYCGLITVMLLPFYFLSDKIPGKQKIVSAVMLMACLCGFALNYFNYIWHGFHMPNDLPYRWSFAYSFILLIIAFKAFRHIGDFSNKAYIGMGFAVISFLVLTEKFEIPNADQLTIILSSVFAILYIVIFGMMRSKKYRKNAITALLFFTVILEIVASDTPKIVMQQPKDAYTSDYENYQLLSESVEGDDTELFYRTELSKLRTRMDASWYGYNGVSIFSSMAYDSTSKIMKKLGLFGNNINSYTYYPQTAVFNSLFSIRYVYDNMDFIQNDDTYTSVGKNEDFEAYRYNYYLPLMFSIDKGIFEWNYDSSNPFTVQNNLMESATGVKDVLIPVEATEYSGDNMKDVSLSSINSSSTFTVSKNSNGSDGKAIVKIKPEEEGNYYIYAGSTKLSALTISAGDLYYNYNSSSIQPFILDLGWLTPDDEVVITYTVPSSNNTATLTFCAAKLDEEKFNEAYNKILENGTIEMTSFEETSLAGKINVTNDNAVLWTSIPYDESWEITVDGEALTYTLVDEESGEVITDGRIKKVGGGLIGIEIDAGEHDISMTYKAKGLGTGIKLTAIGIGITALIIVYKKWFEKLLSAKGFTPWFMRKPDYTNG